MRPTLEQLGGGLAETKRPGNLHMFIDGSSGHDVLKDGAHVLHVSVQLNWVYVKVLTPDGHFRTRRYRHDARVEVRS